MATEWRHKGGYKEYLIFKKKLAATHQNFKSYDLKWYWYTLF